MTDFDRTISLRIQVMRLFLVCGIVVLHTPPYLPLAEVPAEPFALVKSFFQNAFFRLSVPTLSAISGYLLFALGQDRQGARLVRKKAASLVVPFLLWNLPLVLVLYLLQSRGLALSVNPLLPAADGPGWADAMFALRGEPVNYPLGFLRDLFLCAVVALLLSAPFRRAPLTVLGILAVAAWQDLEGPLFLRADIAIPFFTGGAIACRGFNVRALDRHAPALMLALLAACAVLVAAGDARLLFWLRLVGLFCLWPLSAVLVRLPLAPAAERLAPASFWIFCSHAPILWALWVAWQALLPAAPYPVFWLLAPVATILISLALRRALGRVLPALAAVLSGGRAAG